MVSEAVESIPEVATSGFAFLSGFGMHRQMTRNKTIEQNNMESHKLSPKL